MKEGQRKDDVHDDIAADADHNSWTSLGQSRPSVARVVADACLGAALPGDLLRRLKRRTLAVVVTVPGADWVVPIETAAREVFNQATFIGRDGGNKYDHKSDKGSDAVSDALSHGRSVVGISQAPARYLPAALITVADVCVHVKLPDGEVLRRIIARVTGRRPPIDIAAVTGLSFHELVSAFRPGDGPACIVRSLAAFSTAKSQMSTTDDTPPLSALPGYDGEARDWAMRLVDDMAAWRAGKIRWDELSASAVLYGAPGTGKTLFAKALARSLDVPILPTSCGAWFNSSDGHLGDVIQASQRAFDAARAASPCLLFVDELDGIPSRELLGSRGRDWWMPVVNHVLTMMDGAVTARDGVVLVGACNHANLLDPALVRAGRFDRLIALMPPDASVLARVMRFHLRDALPHADLDSVARLAHLDATPADAAQWVRDAAGAARAAGRDLAIDDLVAAVAPPDETSPADQRVAALHEAGHCAASIAVGLRVSSTSIVAHGSSGGGTRTGEARPAFPTRADLDAAVVVMLAGRAAEEVILGEPSVGATTDLAMATRALADVHGAHGLGGSLVHRAEPLSEIGHDRALRDAIEVDLTRLYARTLDLIRQQRAAVERLADALVERRFLSGDDVASLLDLPRNGTHNHGRRQ